MSRGRRAGGNSGVFDPTRGTCSRLVVTGTTFSETDTRSCFSWDKTSRNQPTEPAIARIAPRTLTEALLTNPANTSLKPKASTIDHAVDAASATQSDSELTS